MQVDKDVCINDLTMEDNIVAVLGPTGAGKSTFLEMAMGITGVAGHSLQSCTQRIAIFRCSFPELDSAKVCLVDTPGFDDTHKSDYDVLKPISDWLIKTYQQRLKLKGILYFHRISDNRMDGTAMKTLRYFGDLCGTEPEKVVFITTMWDMVDEGTGNNRVEQLQQIYWKSMVARGSSIKHFMGNRASALDILKPIVAGIKAMPAQMPSNSKATEMATEDLSTKDNIIVLMGPAGSGKSSFIELATNTSGRAGHNLASYTSDISVVRLSFPEFSDWDVCLVDTPGFNDTNKSDAAILEMISDWLNTTYKKKVQLTGLLYFHRISDNRMGGNPLRNLRIFEKLCGKDFKNVVLTTTMWDKVNEPTGAAREKELIQDFWQMMVARGSTVKRFLGNRDSAFNVLKPILEDLNKKNALLLQEEMTDLGLKLNQTTAGRTLFSELERLIAQHQKTLENLRIELKTRVDDELFQQRMAEHRAVLIQLNRTLEDMQRMKISGGEWLQRMIKVKVWKTPLAEKNEGQKLSGCLDRIIHSFVDLEGFSNKMDFLSSLARILRWLCCAELIAPAGNAQDKERQNEGHAYSK